MTTTYDKAMHSLGLACISLLGLSANPELYKHLPWWLMVLATVLAAVSQSSTMPLVSRPIGIAKAMADNATRATSLLVLVTFLGAFTACPPATTTPTGNTAGGGPTPVQTFDACSEKVIQDKGIGLLGLVAQATLGGDYMGALATLAAKYGEPEVLCAVQLFVDTMQRKAAMDATAMSQREHAKAYLAKHVPAPN